MIITITESGTDATVFAKPDNLILDIDNFETEYSDNPEDFAEVNLVVGTTRYNSGSVIVTGDLDGVVYWYFGC